MGEHDLNRRIDELTRRLERIERTLGMEHEQAKKPPTSPKTAPSLTVTGDAPAVVESPSATPLASHLAARREHAQGQKPGGEPPRNVTAPLPAPAAPPTAPVPHRAPRDPSPERGGLEVFLGIKAAAALGAIIVVLGTAFAIREYATGFWATLPTAAQALIIAAFGGALIALGELTARRIGHLGAIGLMSAGLGVLYLDAYAAFQWFDPQVVSQNGSFALMAIVAVIGFALTVRTRSLFIGILSMVLGYLTPLLLAGADGPTLGLLSYLTMLFGIALGLAYARPKPFHALRYAAIGGQGLLGALVLISLGADEWMMYFVFLSIWWVMLMGESVTAALRDRTPIGNVIAALIGTGGYVTLGGWTLALGGPATTEWFAAFLGMVAVLNAAVALQFTSGLDVLRHQPVSAIDKLGVALCAMAGVLITTAIAFQFDGYGMAVAWLVLAVASVEIGRRLPSSGVSVFGLLVLAVALLRVISIDFIGPALKGEVWSIEWLTITHWAILALAAMAAFIIASVRLGEHRAEPWRGLPTILLAGAAIGWLGWCAMHANSEAITAGWLLGSASLLAAHRVLRRQHALEIGLVMLLITAARWLLFDAIADRLDPNWEALRHAPLLNPQMGLAVAIAAAGFWAMRLVRMRAASAETQTEGRNVGSWMQIVCVLAGVFFLVAMSFEVDRAIMQLARGEVVWSAGHVLNVMLTMLWALGGLGFGLLARMFTPRDSHASSHAPWLIGAGWIILSITGAKWLIVDTLFWAIELDRATLTHAAPIFNLQMLAGALVAGTAMLLIHLRATPAHDDDGADQFWVKLGAWIPVTASLVILWGLTFEIDRWLVQRIEGGAEIAWPFTQWRLLWWIGLWTIGGLAMHLVGRVRGKQPLISAGATIVSLTTIAWLTVGTLFWRLGSEAAAVSVLANVQFITGAIALAAILIMIRAQQIAKQSPHALAFAGFEGVLIPMLATLIALVTLWLGTLEIDRAFVDHDMARQMGWSVYWALFGVALVLAGFRFRAGLARYSGLALLAITVGKILIVDLATVDEGWRIVSFIVTGLLLIGTSAAYVKFAPRMLVGAPRSEDGKRETVPMA